MKRLQLLLLMFSTSLMADEASLYAYVFEIGMSEYANFAFIQFSRAEGDNYGWGGPFGEYDGIEISNTNNSPICLQQSRTLLFDITTSVGKNMYLTALNSFSRPEGGGNQVRIERLTYFYDSNDCIEGMPYAKLTRIVRRTPDSY